jgi:hypothetical protein
MVQPEVKNFCIDNSLGTIAPFSYVRETGGRPEQRIEREREPDIARELEFLRASDDIEVGDCQRF